MPATHVILGTAGHTDHGKTTLVRALTGIDTDRLPEEKRRGITIELGFAAFATGDTHFAIVDVPGHEALVRTMLAGATGIDMVLLVIAADEGVMPQTREHLSIMELLNVGAAVVALTKSDAVDDDWLELVTADVIETLSATRFASAPVVPVSARTGAGLEALRAALVQNAAHASDRIADELFRMPVDRVFTVHGTGTVVTGTVWSGIVRADDHVTVMPGGLPARVRGLEVHGVAHINAVAGHRAALALVLDRDQVVRGDTLVSSEAWRATSILTVRLRNLPDAGPIRHRQRVRFHLGTAEILGRVALLDGEEIPPGETAWAQLRLESPAVARAGDRFVIRAYSPVRTIGGGIVAEPFPPKRKRMRPALDDTLTSIVSGDVGHAVLAVVRAAGPRGVTAASLPVRVPFPVSDVRVFADGAGESMVTVAKRLYDARIGQAAQQAVVEAVEAHHRVDPLSRGLTRETARAAVASALGPTPVQAATNPLAGWAIDRLIERGAIATSEGALHLPGFRRSVPDGLAQVGQRLLATIGAAALEAPSTDELRNLVGSPGDLAPLLRYFADTGGIIGLPQDRWLDAAAFQRIMSRLDAACPPGSVVTTAGMKELTGVSRKYLIPIVEHLDRIGVTRREGEDRVRLAAGPRSTAPTTPPTTS